MIKISRIILLTFAIGLFLLSIMHGLSALKIRKAIKQINNYEDSNISDSDSLMIQKIAFIIEGKYPKESLENKSFRYADFKKAMLFEWQANMTSFFFNRIELKKEKVIMTFIGYYNKEKIRKKLSLSVDSVNQCTIINFE